MEDIFYRQMPHSLEAEQSVLGSMLIDANCVKDVMEQLRPDDFYLKQNREIFETIYSMFVYSKPIDGVTVAGEMEKNGTYEESTTRPYLAQNAARPPHGLWRTGRQDEWSQQIGPCAAGRTSRYG